MYFGILIVAGRPDTEAWREERHPAMADGDVVAAGATV